MVEMAGIRGRPRADINADHLEKLLEQGFSVGKIANEGLLGKRYHINTVHKFMRKNGMAAVRSRYSTINDGDLLAKVTCINKEFPKSGYREVQSLLITQTPSLKVQERRVRVALSTADPTGTSVRKRSALKRRVYKVPTPNAFWHLDTNHKLISWNFVIHGCVDGFSRLQTHLDVSVDNYASTSLNHFVRSMREFGIPGRVRIDGGKEFNHVEKFMNQGDKRCIRGKSVHNTRVERLWRDVREKVIDKYRNLFMHMEDNKILNVDSDVQLYALHLVYLPRIRKNLQLWRESWNRHGVRTEKYQTPYQL